MEAVPRTRPQYLHLERTRHGAAAWYFRRGKGLRVRIRGDYGSPEFLAAYEAARTATVPQCAPAAAAGSLAWLIARYRDSGAWARLSAASKRQRENIFRNIILAEGEYPFAKIGKTAILAALDRRRSTPFAALDFLKAMRGLFKWAVEAGFVENDPTERARCQVPRTEGFHAWTEDEIARFEARWPVGEACLCCPALYWLAPGRRGDAWAAACARSDTHAPYRKDWCPGGDPDLARTRRNYRRNKDG
jgi:hypothetical protein